MFLTFWRSGRCHAAHKPARSPAPSSYDHGEAEILLKQYLITGVASISMIARCDCVCFRFIFLCHNRRRARLATVISPKWHRGDVAAAIPDRQAWRHFRCDTLRSPIDAFSPSRRSKAMRHDFDVAKTRCCDAAADIYTCSGSISLGRWTTSASAGTARRRVMPLFGAPAAAQSNGPAEAMIVAGASMPIRCFVKIARPRRRSRPWSLWGDAGAASTRTPAAAASGVLAGAMRVSRSGCHDTFYETKSRPALPCARAISSSAHRRMTCHADAGFAGSAAISASSAKLSTDGVLAWRIDVA